MDNLEKRVTHDMYWTFLPDNLLFMPGGRINLQHDVHKLHFKLQVSHKLRWSNEPQTQYRRPPIYPFCQDDNMTASNNASTSDTPFSSNVCETLNDEI
jgi:hypothetical protein